MDTESIPVEIADFLIKIFGKSILFVETHWSGNPCNSSLTKYNEQLSRKVDNDRSVDLYIQLALPTEFKNIGKYNIGINASI